MKKHIILILTIPLLIILTSCGRYSYVQAELIEYYNEEWIPIIVWKENKIDHPNRKIRDIIFERGNESEETLTIREEEIIPVHDKALDRFKAIQLEDKKLQKLNDLQIEIESLDGTHSIKTNDYYNGELSRSELTEYTVALEEKHDQFDEALEKLMYKHNLKYDKDEGQINGYYKLKRLND